MSLQKVLEKKFIRLFFFGKNSKFFVISCFLISFIIFDLSKARSNNLNFEKIDQTTLDYLDSRKELEDYIIDSGDGLYIKFERLGQFTNTYEVSSEGEILLPRLDETYVRGLTTSELEKLLEKRYLEFLIEPQIKVRIAKFKELRVLVKGEVRYPGLYKFPAYRSGLFLRFKQENDNNSDLVGIDKAQKTNNKGKIKSSNQLSDDIINIKRNSENITTISDVIRKAGGITSSTDVSRIEIIRDIPLGRGGGKKRAFIDLNSFINESDDSNDLRIFDGDSIYIPKLNQPSTKQIPKSILSGLSPRFITVEISGRIEAPGSINLPLEAALSDAIDLTGPRRPLSGKIVLIRYNEDGTILKEKISYSSRAKRGSRRNPLLKEGDLISVKDSILSSTSGVLKEVTAPFLGIYTTKTLIEKFDE